MHLTSSRVGVPRSGAPRRRGARASVALAVAATALAGCALDDRADGGAGAEAPPPTSSPAPDEPDAAGAPDAVGRPAPPDVPVQRADLASRTVEPVVAPTAVTIPAIDVSIAVEPVGVEPDGQMEIPPLAEVGGWYRYGASPAQETGTAVVAAHVDSVASAGLGPFARLRDLAAGDVVVVGLADGGSREYVVTSVVRTPKPEVTWADVFVRDGPHRLVLVTCGGTFQRDARSYADNVIVTAEPRD